MTRGIGGVEFADSLPDPVVAAAGLLTQLGDVWFLLLALAASYWRARGGRAPTLTATPLRDCLFLLALAVGSYAAVATLKPLFALPRPPGTAVAALSAWLPPAAAPVSESLVTADGYGFPSGHATTATAVYGGAAVVLTAGSRRLRYAVAGVVVGGVSLSRVVIGVHYLVDVAVGVVLGLVLLSAFLALVKRFGSGTEGPERTAPPSAGVHSPLPALAGALALAIVALAVAPGPEQLLALCGAGGGVGLWLARGLPTAVSFSGL